MGRATNTCPARSTGFKVSKRQPDMFYFTLCVGGYFVHKWRFNPKNGQIIPPGFVGKEGRWMRTAGGRGMQMKRLQENIWEEFVLWGQADPDFRDIFQNIPGYAEGFERLKAKYAKKGTKKEEMAAEIEKRPWISERAWLRFSFAPKKDDLLTENLRIAA